MVRQLDVATRRAADISGLMHNSGSEKRGSPSKQDTNRSPSPERNIRITNNGLSPGKLTVSTASAKSLSKVLSESLPSPIVPLDLESVIASHPFFASTIQSAKISLNDIKIRDTSMSTPFTISKAEQDAQVSSLTTRDLLSMMHIRNCAAGDLIIRYGTLGRSMFFLLRGMVQVTSRDSEVVHDTLVSGAIFGEIAVLLDTLRTADVLAVEKCLLLVLHKADLGRLTQRYPLLEKKIRMEAEARYAVLTKRFKQQSLTLGAGTCHNSDHASATKLSVVSTITPTLSEISISSHISASIVNTSDTLYGYRQANIDSNHLSASFNTLSVVSLGSIQPFISRSMDVSRSIYPAPPSPTLELSSGFQYENLQRSSVNDLLMKVPLFTRCHDEFLHELVKRIEFYRYSPGETINLPFKSNSRNRSEEGDVLKRFQQSNLFILSTGIAESFIPDNATTLSSMALCKSTNVLSDSMSSGSVFSDALPSVCTASLPSLSESYNSNLFSSLRLVHKASSTLPIMTVTNQSALSEPSSLNNLCVPMNSNSLQMASMCLLPSPSHSSPVSPLSAVGIERTKTIQPGTAVASFDWSRLPQICVTMLDPTFSITTPSSISTVDSFPLSPISDGCISAPSSSYHFENIVRAVTACDVYILSGEAVLECLELHPDVKQMMGDIGKNACTVTDLTNGNDDTIRSSSDISPTSNDSSASSITTTVPVDQPISTPTPTPLSASPRRASIAVWSDPRLLKYAADQMNKAAGLNGQSNGQPTSRFARVDSDMSSSQSEVMSDDLMDENNSEESRSSVSVLSTRSAASVDQLTPNLSITKSNRSKDSLNNHLTSTDNFKQIGLLSVLSIVDFSSTSKAETRKNSSSANMSENVFSRNSIMERICCYLSFTQCWRLRGVCKALTKYLKHSSHWCRHIDLSNRKHTHDGALALISRDCASHVERLALRNCHTITDLGLTTILRSCTRLRHLDISNCWDVSNAAFTALPIPSTLVSVEVANLRKIDNNALLLLLERCPQLSSLKVSYCKAIGDAVFSHPQWRKIDHLELQRCTGVSDMSFVNWQQMYDDKSPTDDSFDTEINSSPLQVTTMTPFYPPAVSVNLPFALTYVNLADCSLLTDIAISVLAAVAPSLTVLSLSFCCSLSENAILDLVRLPQLRALDGSFCGAAFSDSALHLLASNLHQLQVLSVRGCSRISDTGVGYMLELAKDLRAVNLSQCVAVTKSVKESATRKWTLMTTESVLDYYTRCLTFVRPNSQ